MYMHMHMHFSFSEGVELYILRKVHFFFFKFPFLQGEQFVNVCFCCYFSDAVTVEQVFCWLYGAVIINLSRPHLG